MPEIAGGDVVECPVALANGPETEIVGEGCACAGIVAGVAIGRDLSDTAGGCTGAAGAPALSPIVPNVNRPPPREAGSKDEDAGGRRVGGATERFAVFGVFVGGGADLPAPSPARRTRTGRVGASPSSTPRMERSENPNPRDTPSPDSAAAALVSSLERRLILALGKATHMRFMGVRGPVTLIARAVACAQNVNVLSTATVLQCLVTNTEFRHTRTHTLSLSLAHTLTAEHVPRPRRRPWAATHHGAVFVPTARREWGDDGPWPDGSRRTRGRP